jgi:amino acid transporter
LVWGIPTQLSLNGTEEFSILSIFIVSSITFVAFEGFQLVIHAYNEVEDPDKNVPFAIYSAIAIALVIYIVLAVGALSAIPQETLIRDQEFALAAGSFENSRGRRAVCSYFWRPSRNFECHQWNLIWLIKTYDCNRSRWIFS